MEIVDIRAGKIITNSKITYFNEVIFEPYCHLPGKKVLEIFLATGYKVSLSDVSMKEIKEAILKLEAKK